MAWITKRLRKAPGDGDPRPEAGTSAVPDQLQAAMAQAERAVPNAPADVDGLPAIQYTEALDDGRTISISPMVETLLGYTQEEWMADPMLWTHVIHPDDRDGVEQQCWENNRTGQPFEMTYRMITRSGEIKWIRDRAVLVRGSAGRRLCWEGVMVDITSTLPLD
jgi:PAS domain S-box-containing protein